MIIVNKTNPARPLVLSKPLPPTVTGLVQHIPVVLKPGTNEVSDDVRLVIEKSATVKEWMKRSWVKILTGSKDKKGASGVGAFDDDQAVDLVNDCFDMKQLCAWKEGETRESVRIAMVERIAVLKEAAKED